MNSTDVEKEVTAIDFLKSTCDCVNPNFCGKVQRKQEGNEWKALKRVDYQRLETVLEEVQLPSERTISDQDDDSLETICENEVNKNKSWLCSPLSKTETTQQLESDKENERQEEIAEKKQLKRRRSDDSDSNINFVEAQEELVDSRGCRKILSGIMELMPIFSNHQFVCSKDAISVQECELDSVEKPPLPLGKPFFEIKNAKGNGALGELAKLTNSGQKRFTNRLTDPQGNLTEIYEKLRCKTLLDVNLANESSHFINFLLLLTQFPSERKKLLTVNDLSNCGNECSKDVLANQIVGGTVTSTAATAFQIFCKMILTIFGVMALIACVSWNLRKPVHFTDCPLCFIPFLQRKRTYFQTIYERTRKIFGGI